MLVEGKPMYFYLCLHASTQTHFWSIAPRERQRRRLYRTNSCQSQSQASASSFQAQLLPGPSAQHQWGLRWGQRHISLPGAAWGAQHGTKKAQDGTWWHGVTLLPSRWLGSTEGKLRESCIVYWCVYLVLRWKPTQREGWKVQEV